MEETIPEIPNIILFNFLPTAFGLGYPDARLKHSRLFVAIYNVFFISFLIMCFTMTFFYPSKLLLNNGYNAIIKFALWNQFYGVTFYCCYLVFSVTRMGFRLYYFVVRLLQVLYKVQAHISNDLEAHKPFTWIVPLLFLTCPTMIGLEIYFHEFHFFALWCLYVPGIVLILFIIYSVEIIKVFIIFLSTINDHLMLYINDEETTFDKMLTVLEILKPVNKREVEDLSIVFEIYYDVWRNMKLFNTFYGREYLFYFYITIAMSISVVYSYMVALIQTINEKEVIPRTTFAVEYWTFFYVGEMVLLLWVAQKLINESKRTEASLHKIVNMYPHLRDDILIHGLQVGHQKMKITATNFFDVDLTIISAVVLVTFTYLSVFLQVDYGM